MISDGYVAVIKEVETPQGKVEALAFVANKECTRFTDIDVDAAARMIATGAGLLGSNLEYFHNLAEHMAMLGINDMVFNEIRSRVTESSARKE